MLHPDRQEWMARVESAFYWRREEIIRRLSRFYLAAMAVLLTGILLLMPMRSLASEDKLSSFEEDSAEIVIEELITTAEMLTAFEEIETNRKDVETIRVQKEEKQEMEVAEPFDRKALRKMELEEIATGLNKGPVLIVDPLDYTDEDLLLVAKIVENEAGSPWLSNHQLLMVANVLVNRWLSPEFPDDLSEIIHAPRQYDLREGFEEREPSERSLRDARLILDGVRVCPPAVIFQANFFQGSGLYELIQDEILSPSYFCYANNMEHYEDPNVFMDALWGVTTKAENKVAGIGSEAQFTLNLQDELD